MHSKLVLLMQVALKYKTKIYKARMISKFWGVYSAVSPTLAGLLFPVKPY